MFSKEGTLVQGCNWEQVQKLNSTLEEFQKIGAVLFSDKSKFEEVKLAHNLFVLSYSLHARLLDLALSITLIFNAESIIPALILARSIMETEVFIIDLKDRVHEVLKNKTALSAEDNDQLEKIILGKMFSTRRSDFLSAMPELEAKNIISVFRKCEKEENGLLEEYERLSEYAHPNSLGHFLAYTRTDMKHNMIDYNKLTAKDLEFFPLIKLAFFRLRSAANSLESLQVHGEMLTILSKNG